MSKLKVLAVYDSKVEAFMTPWFARTPGEALRSWEKVCNEPDQPICQHPEDYTLFEIGEYEVEKGILHGHAALKSLATGLDGKRRAPGADGSVPSIAPVRSV